MIKFLRNHCDFSCYPVTAAAFLNALLIVPCVMLLPERYGYENSLLENIQMFVLFLGVLLAIKSKVNKKFFYFVAMVLGILILREVNCGRTLFFHIPGTENAFYSWKEIKYGWLAHPLYGLYIAYVAFYFFKNKLFIDLWNFIKNIKFPVWNVFLMLTGMGLGMYAENVSKNGVTEEIAELLFYVSLAGIIYLYGYNKKFGLNKD